MLRQQGGARQDADPTVRPAAGPGRSGTLGKSIWDTLVSEGIISEAQLQQARDMQRDDPRDLGKILVSLNFVTAEEIGRARSRRLRLRYVELAGLDLDRSVVNLVPENVLRKYRALPLAVEEGKLVVALGDPLNIQALEDLRMSSRHSILPVVADEEAIDKALIKLFAAGEDVSSILDGANVEEVEEVGELDLGIGARPDERPVIRLVSSVLQQAISDGASDIHVEPRQNHLIIRFRVDGILREVMTIPQKLQNGVTARFKILSNLNIAEKRLPQDGRFSVKVGGKKVDLRVSTLPTVFGEKMVLRLLETSNVLMKLTDLGFAPEVYEKYRDVFTRPYGAILVTGPTGSGKSTTLYATLNELNTPEKNIITVEDPVEYRIGGINQVQTNAKVGLTFASALRNILRSDPDIVMIGEIRDHETAKIAVESALTGHLVLATLHTNDASSALNRLTDMGVEPFLTSSAVDCVIAQRLARKLCPHCKRPVEIEPDVLENSGFQPGGLSAPDFHEAAGCDRCGGTGYSGRLGIYELMVMTEEIKRMVLSRASNDDIARVAEGSGMVRLKEDGLYKAARGLTTIEEVLRTVV
ncbi:GspE/PulE family protein [Rubrobacter indicoceani]|uniref:GspE/PulE family protein n=1 Tax=Rubrobacter indicoceani TaxID=2051957 RepID=UPI000E5C0EAB|nr:ATPase, T2SS/T4P/T4SS family [Rubrobacter indicoceani]